MGYRLLLACLLALSCSETASTSQAPEGQTLAMDRAETRSEGRLALTSPAFAGGAAIPLRHSAYGEGISPELRWSGVPRGTASLVLMLEDPDSRSARPYVHWLVWNIPADSTGLPEGLAGAPAVVQGRNNRGSTGYFGPRPPGVQPHHYHFQLFALDTRLDLPAGARREELLAAMNGHVLAKGDLIGLFARPD